MPDRIQIRFNEGYVSARDRSELAPGECRALTGYQYLGADTTRIHKMAGRAAFGTAGANAAVKGLVLCQFDSGGTDKLVALTGTTLVSATPGITGTFSSLATGLSSSSTRLIGAHAHDRWYLTNGFDRMRVLESDGTIRVAGMFPPVVRPIVTPGVATTSTGRPTANSTSGTWVNITNAYDSSATTFAVANLSAAGSVSATFSAYASNTTPGRVVSMRYRLAGIQNPASDSLGQFGVGGASDAGFLVNLLVEWSENDGSSYSPLLTRNGVRVAMGADETVQTPVTANSNLVRLRVTMTYVSGTSPASIRVADTPITVGVAANFTTTTGMYWAWGEYDASRGLYSPAGPESVLTTFTAQNQAVIKTPVHADVGSTAQNTNSTHWVLYRNFDSATATIPESFGQVALFPIAATLAYDNFDAFTKDEQPTPLYAMKEYSTGRGTLRLPRDTPPPLMDFIVNYRGGLVGVKGRTCYYSEPGRFIESWPESNVIATFDLPEHDNLVAVIPIGSSVVFLASEAVIIANDLPREIAGTYNAAKAEPLPGAPGCVGAYAATAYSVAGEPRAAWVSRYGIHVTNSQVVERISGDLDWETEVVAANLSTAVLKWIPDIFCLLFAWDATGAGHNNRWALIHMAGEQQKQNGLPKYTMPHYGKINCLAGGPVSGTYRLYSGHPVDGVVYLEQYGTVDASGSYQGTLLPAIATTGRYYNEARFWSALRGSLYHTGWGAGETATLVWTAGDDQSGSTQTVTRTVSLADQRGTDLLIGRLGEWAEVTLTQTGTGAGAIGALSVEAEAGGYKGRISG